jgi:peptide/nickel transport system permease protein
VSTVDAPGGPLPDVARTPSRARALLGALRRHPQAAVGGVVLLAFVAIAVFGPLFAPYGEREQVGPLFGTPSGKHPLGLDDGGIDVLSLLIYGARVTLIVGFAGAVVAMLVGGTIGIVAGYFGGRIDNALMRVTDYFLVIPDLVLMIVIASIWGRSLRNIILIIGLVYWTFMARLIRSQVKVVRERAYVKRAEALGASHARIILRHVIPQIMPLLLAQTVLMVALAIFLETAISFLGLGDPSVASWGKMIENAFERSAISYGAWWAIVPPGIAVALVIMAFNMVGTAAEDALNPRLRVSHLSRRHFRLRPPPDRGDRA